MRKQILHKVSLMILGLTCLGLITLWPRSAIAANPATVNFQGKVVNSDGTNVSNGTYSFIFRIYNVSNPTMTSSCTSTASCLWQETQSSVSVTNGVFQVELGSNCALTSSSCNNATGGPISYATNNSLYLTLQFNGDTSGSNGGFMSPLMHITSVPFALYSDNSAALGGLAAGNFVQLAQGIQTDGSTSNASIGINKTGGTANILQLQKSGSDVLVLDNNGYLLLTPPTNLTAGQAHVTQTFTNSDTTAGTVYGYNQTITVSNASGSTTTRGINIALMDSTSLSNTNIGIRVDLAGTNTASNNIAVSTTVARGISIKGISSNFGSGNSCGDISSSLGIGICADYSATNANTGTTAGLYGRNNIETNTNALASAGGSGVYGVASVNGGSGTAANFYVGVKGRANPTNNAAYTSVGVYGDANGGATSNIYGGYFSLQNSGSAASAALYASNSTTTSNILKLQDGSSDVFVVGDGGAFTFSPQGTANITLNLDSDSFLIAGGDSINEFAGDGLTVTSNALTVRLDTTAADGATTSSVSGLELVGGELSLIRGCAAGDLLKWDNTNFEWDCAVDIGAGSSPFTTTTGTISQTTATDQLNLVMGEAGDYGLKVSTSVAPTVDLVQIVNANASATDGVDGLALSFSASNADGDALHITPSFTANGSDTLNIIEIDALSMGSSSGSNTVNGLLIGNLTESGTVTSTAISVGTGWDTGVSIGFTSSGPIGRTSTGLSVATQSDTILGNSVKKGIDITSGSLTQDNVGSTGTYTGIDITNPALTLTTGTAINAHGLRVATGSITQSTGTLTQNGVFIDTSAGTLTSGTLNGVKIGNISDPGGGVTSTAISLGSGWDTGISLGANIISGTTGSIDFDDFDLDNDGNISLTPDGGGPVIVITPSLALAGDAITLNLTVGSGITTDNVDGIFVQIEGGNGTSTDVSGVHVDFDPISGSGDDTFTGLLIDGITGTSATENAITIGSGWDNVLSVSGTAVIGSTGLISTSTSVVSGSYTGVTGTGALDAGSITSNFGAINIGADTLASGAITTTGTLTLSGVSTDITTSTDEALTIVANGTGDTVFSLDTDSNLQITATAAPGVDMVALSNSGFASTTDGIDGLTIAFSTSNADGDALHITPLHSGDGSDTYNGIELDAFTATTSAGVDLVNGLKIGNLTEAGAGTITSYAINIGTGCDRDLSGIGWYILSSGTFSVGSIGFNYSGTNRGGISTDAAITQAPLTTTTTLWNMIAPAAMTADAVSLNFSAGSGITTDNVDGVFVQIEGGNGTSTDVSGIHVDFDPITGSSDDTFTGVLIDGITGTSATENAITIGSGWDTGLSINSLNVFSGAGVLSTSTSVVTGSYTGITGTGALNAGSIISGFGAIDVGADGITTTGTVSGNDFDRTASGTLSFGNTNATTVDICGSSGCDTINIGSSGADTDAINIGTSGDTTTIAGAITLSGFTSCDSLTTNGSGVLACGSGQPQTKQNSGSGSTALSTSESALTSVAITPTSSSNEILIIAKVTARSSTTQDRNTTIRIRRGANCTATQVGTDASSFSTNSSGDEYMDIFASRIDAPATTSSTTYQLCALADNTSITATYWDITVMEVNQGADYAELYNTNDTTIEPGDLVTLDSTITAGVKKSARMYDSGLLGIVSTRPGAIVGGGDRVGANAVPVALVGRVPVKVNSQNGAIKAGDLLTSSSTPGTAMRATRAGQIIGQAITDYSGSDIGYVLAFVKTDFSNGTSLNDLLTGLNLNQTNQGNRDATNPTNFSTALLTGLMNLATVQPETISVSDITTDRLAAGVEIITPKVTGDKLSINLLSAATGRDIQVSLKPGGHFMIENTDGNQIVSFGADGNTYLQRLSVALDLKVAGDFIANGALSVRGDASFLSNVNFGGHITTSGDAPGIDLGEAAGVVSSQASTDMIANAEIDGNDNSGILKITVGSNSNAGDLISIDFKKPYAKTPKVFLTPTNGATVSTRYYVSATKTGFKIILLEPATGGTDLQFNYLVIQ